MQKSFIFGGNTNLSYDQIQKQRDIANELLRANMSTPQNVGEGLSAIGRALAAKAIDKRTTRADDANRAASAERRAGVFGSIFGGVPGGATSPSSAPAPFAPAPAAGPGAAVADDTMAALGKTPMRPFRDAIASIESAGSGDYAAVGPTNPRLGRALGRYQIMEANIGPWSREVLGREVTPDEFLANPKLQDAIFDGKFGGYVEQFGPDGAAQAWFAGPGGVGKMDRQDVLGTSVADYTQKFTAALGGSPQMQPAPAGNMSMGNPGTIQAIADLLADPYTPPGEKAMLEQAMAMQLQGMDPLRQMEMQRAQLELQQMQQPQAPEQLTERQALAAAGGLQPGTPEYQTYMLTGEMPGGGDNPASVQEYQFYAQQAQARGETPMPYEEFVTLEAAAGNPGNAPELGKLSQDFMYDTNPDGTPKRDADGRLIAIPVPGSPAAIEAEQAAAAKERRELAKFTEADVIITAAQRAREAAGNRDFGATGSSLVGWAFPQSDSGEVIRQIKTLKSNGTFSALQQMRDNSPTGAALGAASDRDLELLADKAGALDPASPNIQRDLDDYERTLLRTLYGPEEGDRVFNETRQGALPPPDGDGWQTINGVKVRVKQ